VLAVRALLGRGLTDRARDAVARLRQIDPAHPDLPELNAAAGGTEEVVLVPADEVVEEAAKGALDEDLALAVAGDVSEEIVDDEPVAPTAPRDAPVAPAPSVEARVEAAALASAESDEILPEPTPQPAKRAVPAPGKNGKAAAAVEVPDLSDELEEADFFVQQGLLDEARDSLGHLLEKHPRHPVVLARLADVERRVAPAAPPAPTSASDDVADESFDIARELADELEDRGGGTGSSAADEEFQYSVEDVFSQFKKGVEQTVKPEDSATHYDLGIAYKEMALLDDAIHEFETALRGNDKRREVDCLSMIGLCRMAKGEPKEAIRAFRRALGSETLTKEAAKAIQYELGAAYEAAGDAEVGLWFLQRVAKADAAFRDVAARVAALGGGPGRPPPDARGAPRAAPPKPAPAAAKKNIGYL
jgi:tetratricopeptide (TPR) repeat protein